ncbi:hypothetical protein [Pseudoteredinibacter isoporae]|uniref:hypothetical protein n=1 Tax=Pseudoteredinibacter isoporae TaxID=570281 RepID=UPI00310897B7
MKTLMTTLLAVLALSLSSLGYSKDCKGQSQSACGKSGSCSWVDGYQRKDGKKVKGYCRVSAGKAKNSLSAKSKSAEKKAKSSASKAKAKTKAKAKKKSKSKTSKSQSSQ